MNREDRLELKKRFEENERVASEYRRKQKLDLIEYFVDFITKGGYSREWCVKQSQILKEEEFIDAIDFLDDEENYKYGIWNPFIFDEDRLQKQIEIDTEKKPLNKTAIFIVSVLVILAVVAYKLIVG